VQLLIPEGLHLLMSAFLVRRSGRPCVALVLTVTLLTLAGYTSFGPEQDGAVRPSVSAVASPEASEPVTAADRLRHLADTLTALPGDSKDAAAYPYTYLRIQLRLAARSAV